jgi:hypothetical protein
VLLVLLLPVTTEEVLLATEEVKEVGALDDACIDEDDTRLLLTIELGAIDEAMEDVGLISEAEIT